MLKANLQLQKQSILDHHKSKIGLGMSETETVMQKLSIATGKTSKT